MIDSASANHCRQSVDFFVAIDLAAGPGCLTTGHRADLAVDLLADLAVVANAVVFGVVDQASDVAVLIDFADLA